MENQSCMIAELLKGTNTTNLFFQKSQRRQQHAVKETEFLRLKRSRLGVEDFESLRVIGKGAFGEVGIDAHIQ